MRLPWVSRAAHDLALAEIDRLNTRLDGLLDHFKRVERREAGLPEVPRQEKPREPMPPDVYDMFRSLYGDSSGATQGIQKRDMIQLFKETGSWDTVRNVLQEEMGEG